MADDYTRKLERDIERLEAENAEMFAKYHAEQHQWRESFNRVQRYRRVEIDKLDAVRKVAHDEQLTPGQIVGEIQELLAALPAERKAVTYSDVTCTIAIATDVNITIAKGPDKHDLPNPCDRCGQRTPNPYPLCRCPRPGESPHIERRNRDD